MPGLLGIVHQQMPDVQTHVMAYQVETHPDYRLTEQYMRQSSPACTTHPNVFRQLLHSGDSGAPAWRSFKQRWGEFKLGNFEKGWLSDAESIRIADDLLNRLPLELLDDLRTIRPQTAAAIEQAGFAIYNSSTSLSFGRLGLRNLWRGILPMMMPMLIARAAKVPYGFSPLSFEALDWPIPLLYRPLFGDAKFLYCRDSDSLRYLQQHGLANGSSGVRADNCIYFDGEDESWAEQFMRDNELLDKQFIGLMPRIPDPAPNSGDPLSSPVSAERTASHMRKNIEFIEQWVAQTGMKVLICHETTASIKLARQHIWNGLSAKAQSRCVCMDHFWNPMQARSIYKRMETLVSMELHSALLALSAGTPILHHPLIESGRKREMFADFGFPDWLFDIDEATTGELLDTALHIHHNRERSEERIRQLLPGLKKLGDAMVSEMQLNWRRD
jgi:hypothetical protein